MKQTIVTLDMEGVLTPEIWIAVAEKTGITELRRTTRDELVIVRLVARCAAQFDNACFLGDSDPDFRRQYAFHIQGNNGLLHSEY